MKWLFALLVALNLIVFGGMVAYRMAVKQNQPISVAPAATGKHEPAPPPQTLTPAAGGASYASEPAANADSGDIQQTDNQASEPQSDVSDREKAATVDGVREPNRKAQEEQEAKIKEKEQKEREERLKRERREKAAENQKAAAESAHASAQQCSSASVTIDEDDYHRIKGLLGRWPHAATRSVEQRVPKTGGKKSSKTYRVLVSTGGDAVEQLGKLSAKGFNGTLYNGEISVGVTRSRSAAQILISRLSSANIGGARILEDDGNGNSESESALSVARMNVTFMSVDSRAAQEINNVVGRYGKLNLKNCK